MILPIKGNYKLGYTFGVETFYSEHHFGVDLIVPEGTPVFAPEDGRANYFIGSEAGKAIYLRVNASRINRLMHLDTFLVYDGKWVSEGELLGYSGNTGLSTAPHLHWDIFRGGELKIENFIDPLKELNNQNTMPQPKKKTITMPDLSIDEVKKKHYAYFLRELSDKDSEWWSKNKTGGEMDTEWQKMPEFTEKQAKIQRLLENENKPQEGLSIEKKNAITQRINEIAGRTQEIQNLLS